MQLDIYVWCANNFDMKWFALTLALAAAYPAHAEYRLINRTIAGVGGQSSGVLYQNHAAGSQASGIAYSRTGSPVILQNYAGFMGTFSLMPHRLAVDGLPHELSADNDGDGLFDDTEIIGSAFNPATPTDPNRADTSGDGVSDGAHAMAGTDPTSTESFLRILGIEHTASDIALSWLARQDKTYRVVYTDLSHAYPTNLLMTVSGGPGHGPWQVTTNTLLVPASIALRTFAIEVQAP